MHDIDQVDMREAVLDPPPPNRTHAHGRLCVVCPWHQKLSSGGAPTPAGTSVFTKHNWDMGMGYLWLKVARLSQQLTASDFGANAR